MGRTGTKSVGNESNAAIERTWEGRLVGRLAGRLVGRLAGRLAAGARLVDARFLSCPEEYCAHVRLERQLCHALALGGEAASAVYGTEGEEQLESIGEALRRWGREELEAAHVVDAERLEL